MSDGTGGRINLDRPFWLPVVLALGFLVRLLGIQSRGLQYDDVFSIFLANRSLEEIVQGTAADTMPPLYYFLLHFWTRVWTGAVESVSFLRLLSVLLSLLAIWLIYLIGERLYSRPVGLVAAGLAAISPFQFYHAQDIRNYALLFCAQLAFLYFFVRTYTEEKNSVWDWVGMVLCGAAAMYTHSVAVYGLIGPILWLIMRRDWKRAVHNGLALLAVAVISLPWLMILPDQIAKVQRAWWQNPPGIIELLQIPVVWTAGLPLEGIWLPVGLFLGILVVALLLFEARRIPEKTTSIELLLAVLLTPPVLMFLSSYTVKPMFVPRGFIISSGVFFILAARIIVLRWTGGAGKLVLGGFIAAALIGLPSQVTFASFPRSPFDAAGTALADLDLEGATIVHDNKLSYFPMAYYHPELAQEFVQDEPGSSNDTFAPASQKAMQVFPQPDLQSAVGDAQRVYFVVFTETIADYLALGEAQHPGLAWLSERYKTEDVLTFNDLEVHVFTRP